jgi:hypothetical protein
LDVVGLRHRVRPERWESGCGKLDNQSFDINEKVALRMEPEFVLYVLQS